MLCRLGLLLNITLISHLSLWLCAPVSAFSSLVSASEASLWRDSPFHTLSRLASRPPRRFCTVLSPERPCSFNALRVNMGFDCVGIVSKDLQKSVEFYGILGVQLAQAGGPEHMEGTTESGVRIMLDSHELMKRVHKEWVPPSAPSGVTLGFKQASPSTVDEVHAAVTRAGFESVKEPWDAFWGQRYASVRDPDGNNVDLFAEL
mmetsp:Transcript_14689/g.34495  ORF Transcript_14689/g.34495 Transcript_14689/m.34495 type:complete len:204 (+) Transcript_14689:46-657(+)